MSVIPAKAGTPLTTSEDVTKRGSRLRGNDELVGVNIVLLTRQGQRHRHRRALVQHAGDGQ